MKGKILESPQSRFTARALAKELNVPCGRRVERFEDTYFWVFRYGNISHLETVPPIIINKKYAISKASNKFRCRVEMRDNGIPTPRLFYRKHIEEVEDIPYPLIARPRNHFKGRHFYLAKNKSQARNYLLKGYYLQEIIDKDEEYRIFIFRDKIFEVNIKKKIENGKKNELIRNHDNGWDFYCKKIAETDQNLKDYSRKAMRIVNLDWGAVDCCMDTKGGIYIFEINSAPSLIDRKVTKLASKIREYIAGHSGTDNDEEEDDEIRFTEDE